MPCSFSVLVGVALLSAVVSISAQEKTDPLPAGEQICDRAEQALGDPKKIAAIRNVVYRGKTEYKGMGGAKGTVKEVMAKPMKARSVTDFPGMGKMEEGTDGKVFWEINGPQGVTIHEGNPRELKEHGYAAALLVPWRKIYQRAECVGVEDVGGRPSYKVKLAPFKGLPEFAYFDRETYLTHRVDLRLQEPLSNQELPIEIRYDDYREVAGIQISHRRVIKVSVMEIVFTYDEVLFDQKLPKGQFDLPDVVKKKLEERKADSKR